MFKRFKSWFLKIFGDIKVFKYPLWIVYDPVLYQIKAADLRLIEDTLQIGDIVTRGFVHYLDGYFIPGRYSHSGIYIGDHKIIHAVAEGVSEIDVLDFFQADRGAIYRLKSDTEYRDSIIQKAIRIARGMLGVKYDYFFTEGDDALYCHELTAACFRESCDIQKQIATMSGWLKWIKKKEPVYLASSFEKSPNFETVLEV